MYNLPDFKGRPGGKALIRILPTQSLPTGNNHPRCPLAWWDVGCTVGIGILNKVRFTPPKLVVHLETWSIIACSVLQVLRLVHNAKK